MGLLPIAVWILIAIHCFLLAITMIAVSVIAIAMQRLRRFEREHGENGITYHRFRDRPRQLESSYGSKTAS